MALGERFWSKVDKRSDGCWEWTAAKAGTHRGYGYFWHNARLQRAHRVAYEELIGPVPAGLDLDHLCRHKGCVNPAHLEPVTRRVNLLRGDTVTAASASRTHCPQGHPYSDENIYRSASGNRRCRICTKASNRRSAARRALQLRSA